MGTATRRYGQEGAGLLNRVLADRPYLALDTFTLPDITLYISLIFAEAIGLISSEQTSLAAWRAKVDELPFVKNRTGQALRPEDLARLSG
jgi:glutathione S-transferase